MLEPWESGVKKSRINSLYVVGLIIAGCAMVVGTLLISFVWQIIFELTRGSGATSALLEEYNAFISGDITSLSMDSILYFSIPQFISEFSGVIVIILVFRKNYQDDAIRFKKDIGPNILILLIGAALVFASQIIMNVLFTNVFHIEGTSENQNMIDVLFSGLPIIQTVSVLFVAPILEEFLFRKCIYGVFVENLKWNKWIAIAIMTIVFALVHATDIWFFAYLPMAFVMSYAYDKSKGNIFVSMGIHFINNFIAWIMMILSIAL